MRDLHSRDDRFLGCLLGLAVGDALGTTLEFRERGTFEPLTDIVGGGPFQLRPGEWTDDTTMALCLGTSLIERGGCDLRDQLEKYLSWYRGELTYRSDLLRNSPDIGMTVLESIKNYENEGEIYSGASEDHNAGNGSLMRLAPVPMFYSHDLNLAIRFSEESSRTTHQEPRCLDACRYYGALIWGALNGVAKERLLRPDYPERGFWRLSPFHPEIDAIVAGDYKLIEEPESTGYVVHTLRAALWAFYNSSDFKTGALRAANLGGDADTVTAVYGQLAGAYYGRSGIPVEWLQKVSQREMIERVAIDLSRVSSITQVRTL